MPKILPLVHPGEILREEFLKPLGWSVSKFPAQLKVPAQRINEIVRERCAITAETALRLGKFFGTSPEFWMNLQSFYELRRASNESGALIRREIRQLKRARDLGRLLIYCAR